MMRRELVTRSFLLFVALLAATRLRAQNVASQATDHHGHRVTLPDDASIARFVAAARSGTERYRDQQAAIEDGFRVVGPDFPGMGEHWIHIGRLLQARFDPARPSLLQYARSTASRHSSASRTPSD